MAFRLRKLHPPFGTEGTPIKEYTYSEQVTVVEGKCEVERESTRDFLLKIGYEEIKEKAEPVSAGSSQSSPAPQDSEPQSQPAPKGKKRR